MSLGDRGKATEKSVEEWLIAKSAMDARFAWHRFPDARAAQGRMSMAQPADYLVSRRSSVGQRVTTLLEAKESGLDGRLPKKKIRQYGKLKSFWLAGMDIYVVVHVTSPDYWTYLTGADFLQIDPVPPSFKLCNERFESSNDLLNYIYGY